MRVVVCGAGVIGASVAYYLAKRGVQCTVVERCSPACAASGKAGGFLARDWCDHNELGPLARLSFDLHADLAGEFGDIDYRRLDVLSVRLREGCVLQEVLKMLSFCIVSPPASNAMARSGLELWHWFSLFLFFHQKSSDSFLGN
jgi:glycine/D-amino acid oxidase-like deaminating enzyme